MLKKRQTIKLRARLSTQHNRIQQLLRCRRHSNRYLRPLQNQCHPRQFHRHQDQHRSQYQHQYQHRSQYQHQYQHRSQYQHQYQHRSQYQHQYQHQSLFVDRLQIFKMYTLGQPKAGYASLRLIIGIMTVVIIGDEISIAMMVNSLPLMLTLPAMHSLHALLVFIIRVRNLLMLGALIQKL